MGNDFKRGCEYFIFIAFSCKIISQFVLSDKCNLAHVTLFMIFSVHNGRTRKCVDFNNLLDMVIEGKNV